MKTIQETLNPNSAEIGRSAAGKVTFTVKSYGDTTAAAYAEAKAIFEIATEDFPKE